MKILLVIDSGWIWSCVENWWITSVPYSKPGPIAQGPVLVPVLVLVPVPLVFTHKYQKLVKLVKPVLHLVRVVRGRVTAGVVLVVRLSKVESFHWMRLKLHQGFLLPRSSLSRCIFCSWSVNRWVVMETYPETFSGSSPLRLGSQTSD